MPPGKADVLIGNLPAAVVGNQCDWAAPMPDTILAGSPTVLIGG